MSMPDRTALTQQLRAELERLTREVQTLKVQKKEVMKGFNDDIKQREEAIADVLGEIDSCQVPLFDKDGAPTIGKK